VGCQVHDVVVKADAAQPGRRPGLKRGMSTLGPANLDEAATCSKP
jgi:hypothetical protein